MLRQMIVRISSFADEYLGWLNMPRIGIVDVVEILIIAFFLYYVIRFVKNTRAWTLFKGILLILIFVFIAALFQMNTILWLFQKLLSFGVIALLIIFQPELRRALERLGRSNLFAFLARFGFGQDGDRLFSEETVSEVVRACKEMARAKTGALIVIERDISLDEYIRSGIALRADVSSELLLNIFEHNTPLHDGAVIMQGDRIAAATCYLPLSENRRLSKEMGTRHRAAVGISEVSDSLTIVVSEETGQISIAMNRWIERDLSEYELKGKLENFALKTQEKDTAGIRRKRRLVDADDDKEETL